ncbi:MAG TPA: M4 family metallopeptidase [Panacibacter sp.]|nr:M4 family metallopeptidase [Panacibacter sp.]HNP43274.1 M4 family metallopeptidase [Panacibacter sp.]
MCNRLNHLHCILPPYIADKLVDKGSEKNKQEALENKLMNHRLRSDRLFLAALSPHQQKMMAVSPKVAKKPKPIIEVYSCNNLRSLPGTKMSKTGTKFRDGDAQNVYDGGLQTWKFYYDLFKRNSIDDQGMAMIHSVHYGKRYNNAMWNGRQMLYGDGDKKVFDSFTKDIDIIGHELTHGVTQFTANLNYEFQSGALNESVSDIFGIMIKQRAMKLDVKKSDWLIGGNVMLGDQYALRSMKAPGTAFKNHPQWGDDPQPATMDGYLKMQNTEEDDWGGVHFNSGIPNFAFYVMAYNMGGFSWEKAGQIWYAALTKELTPSSDFAAAKTATIKQAGIIFGKASLEVKAVKAGWKAAKV